MQRSSKWARTTDTQYQDIFMRDFVGDTGQIPSTMRDSVYQSPDIIPFGPSPDPNYATDFANNYNGPFNYYQNISSTAYNYIYVRGYNLFPGAQTGTINLYYARASMLLLPSQWINNIIPNTNGTTAANLSASATNQVVVGQGAFYWQPPGIVANDHYCLIAQVVTSQDPDTIPESLEDFATFVAYNPGIAWRNIALVSTSAPNYSAFVLISNPDPQAEMMTLAVTCTNIPDGTSVSIIGSEPTPSINYSATVGPQNQTGTNPKINQFGTLVAGVPGNFQESIQLSATAPSGSSFPVGSTIEFQYYLNRSSQHTLARIGVDPRRFQLDPERLGVQGPGVMIPLGGYAFQFGE
jgi:hypothetical protein